MSISDFLRLLSELEQRFGPLIAAAVARLFKARTTITYTDEQTASFLENEIKAMQYRADDLERAGS